MTPRLSPSPFRRFFAWLNAAPIDDPVERRTAPAVQVLLLFLGISIPAAWGYHLFALGLPRGGWLAVALAALIACAVYVALAMVRRGRFRDAVRIYLSAVLGSQFVLYLDAGYARLMVDQGDLYLCLVVGGLALGRRAVWTVFALIAAISLAGGVVDAIGLAAAGADPQRAFYNLPSTWLSHFVVAAMLDQMVKALRESLRESVGDREALRREMAARERIHQELLHAQKLEVTGRLVAGVAHDCNHLLHVMQGFARQREELMDLGDARRAREGMYRALEGVEAAAARGLALTRRLVDFNRRDPRRAEVVDLAAAVRDLLPMLRQMLPPRIGLESAIDPGPLPVSLVRGEFELMLFNLAANARDAMPDGGVLQICAQARDGWGRIVVADEGVGIAPEIVGRIFEPFFTTKRQASGAGLGLSMIRDRVEALGGRIGVHSAPGQGSRFELELPLHGAVRRPRA